MSITEYDMRCKVLRHPEQAEEHTLRGILLDGISAYVCGFDISDVNMLDGDKVAIEYTRPDKTTDTVVVMRMPPTESEQEIHELVQVIVMTMLRTTFGAGSRQYEYAVKAMAGDSPRPATH
jgi:hypothetical protein